MNIYIRREGPIEPLAMIRTGQFAASRHYVWNVPDDIEKVRVYIRRAGDPAWHFRSEALLLPSGVWRFDVKPGMTPDAGTTAYEVYGERQGEKTLLGKGVAEIVGTVLDEQVSAPVPTPGRVVIYDADGHPHTLSAVPDGHGNFTTVVDA